MQESVAASIAGVLCAVSLSASIADAFPRPAVDPQTVVPMQPERPPAASELPQEVVANDNTRITKSCRLILAPRPLLDADNNGVIQIEGDDIVVDLAGQTLFGADGKTPRDELQGIGIHMHGKRITVRNGTVSGLRVGLAGVGCDHAVIEGMEFIRNYSQRLTSTPEREDLADWLTPQNNDKDEWATKYGAAISISDAQGVVVREIGVRQGQNGILLSRVSNSQIYNCDASFLSGWGLAMWRSCSNMICRNSFDFCVRGYSHGIYNRGQDSAGILCFEQSSDNTIAMNSATHCGDGFFGFAGREALGEIPAPPSTAQTSSVDWYRGRGCNRNLIALNDFSDSAAHGLELTFSFENRILRNRFDRNSICGVWGGYSHGLDIRGNRFFANGERGHGIENGGVNIEHGSATTISDNQFTRNTAGVRLWWDGDSALASLPWAKSNGVESARNQIVRNTFENDGIGIFLRSSTQTMIAANVMKSVVNQISTDEVSEVVESTVTTVPNPDWTELLALEKSLPGEGNAVELVDGLPISKRTPLAGRASIVIGEFGPYDFIAPMAVAEPGPTNVHRWKLLGSQPIQLLQVSEGRADLRTNIDPTENTAIVETETLGHLTNYELAIFWGRAPDQVQRVRGTIFSANWRLEIFPLPALPEGVAVPDLASFKAAAKDPYVVYVESLNFPFGTGGPDSVKLMPTSPPCPADRFGIRATTTFEAAPGDWIVRTNSDDGIRVSVNGKVVIDRWTHHGRMVDEGRFTVPTGDARAREVSIQVDYFELDGEAVLDLRIVPDSPRIPTTMAAP